MQITRASGLDGIVRLGALVIDGAANAAADPRLDGPLSAAEAAVREHPPEESQAVRAMYRRIGLDPTKTRPSSEALLRRLLKGEELPAIHPLVDLNNQLSIELKAPCCVVRDGSFSAPVTLRAGRAGETLDSMRGPLDLEGKPLLEDAAGPFGTPITDSHRVKVLPETIRAWLVAYLPEGAGLEPRVPALLDEILAEAPVARRIA